MSMSTRQRMSISPAVEREMSLIPVRVYHVPDMGLEVHQPVGFSLAVCWGYERVGTKRITDPDDPAITHRVPLFRRNGEDPIIQPVEIYDNDEDTVEVDGEVGGDPFEGGLSPGDLDGLIYEMTWANWYATKHIPARPGVAIKVVT